jgi:hypothetical protein
MKLPVLPLIAALSLAGCAAAPRPAPAPPLAEATDGLSRAMLGETAHVGGPRVTPLEVLEDSRCPMNVQCVWAGRVRVKVRIDLGSGSQVRVLTQGKPVPVADGTLELVEVRPDKPEGVIASSDYRLGLRFMGGL